MSLTRSAVRRISPPETYCSGIIKPLKPSRMPYTSHPRLRAASVAALITAFSPGASPPPVQIAIRLIVDVILLSFAHTLFRQIGNHPLLYRFRQIETEHLRIKIQLRFSNTPNRLCLAEAVLIPFKGQVSI